MSQGDGEGAAKRARRVDSAADDEGASWLRRHDKIAKREEEQALALDEETKREYARFEERFRAETNSRVLSICKKDFPETLPEFRAVRVLWRWLDTDGEYPFETEDDLVDLHGRIEEENRAGERAVQAAFFHRHVCAWRLWWCQDKYPNMFDDID